MYINSPTFDIQISFSGDAAYASYFTSAARLWELAITGDLPDVVLDGVAIDDLAIDASVVPIDGPSNILGSAGPTNLRDLSLLPSRGIMQFDVADLSGMLQNNTLAGVILHEMGHVLGIGSLWGPSAWSFVNGSAPYRYTGTSALAEYRSISNDPSATYVPVENAGGAGTAGGHWSEAIFDKELMTGYADVGGMPISRMTIAALRDAGYVVDLGYSDPYWLGSTPITRRDDFSGNFNASIVLSIGGTISASIEQAEDNDWFIVNLTAGTAYTFAMRGNAAGGGTLADTALRLRAADGETLAVDSNGVATGSQVFFTAPTSGQYFLDASATGLQIGSYTLTAAISQTRVSIDDVTVVEGDTGTKVAIFTVTRAGGNAAFSINYATANNSAIAGNDYGAVSGTLSFAAGIDTQTISIVVNGDTEIEGYETFTVNLSSLSGAGSIVDGQGVGTISDDDSTLPLFTLGNDQIALTVSNGTWHGLAGNDQITGTNAVDAIYGDDGHDTLIGGGEADALYGGSGNDVVWADANDVLLDGGVGGDYLVFSDAASHSFAAGSAGFETIIGNAGIDLFDATGSSVFMVIWGNDGADNLTLGGGNGYIYGGNGGDRLFGGSGINTLIGDGGADSLTGGSNTDVLWVDGQDSINGGGGFADWAIIASQAGDNINVANTGIEVAAGGAGNDVVIGTGSATGITFWGAGGNDNLWGGNANDNFYGGTGADIFWASIGGGLDQIWDWQDGVDRIAILGVSNLGELSITSSGSTAIIGHTQSGYQLYVHLAAGAISSADFVFN